MRLNIAVRAVLQVQRSAPALFQMEAQNIEGVQKVDSSTFTMVPEPEREPEAYFDLYGNPCSRMVLTAGENVIEYKAVVSLPDERVPELLRPVETDAMALAPELLHYLLPSRYCQSDRLAKVASDLFEHHKPGYARVLGICEWINEHVTYQYGTSNASTSAVDTLVERQGVCRDFAHLAVSLCRALNIPARYVSGYCLNLDPPDFHAFFQAYLDGRWVSFDATELQPRPALIEVATGRDAADCAWCTLYAPGSTTSLSVDVELAT